MAQHHVAASSGMPLRKQGQGKRSIAPFCDGQTTQGIEVSCLELHFNGEIDRLGPVV